MGEGSSRVASLVEDDTVVDTDACLLTFPFGEGGPLAVDEVKFDYSNISQPHPSCFASHLSRLRWMNLTFPFGEG